MLPAIEQPDDEQPALGQAADGAITGEGIGEEDEALDLRTEEHATIDE